MTQDKRRAGADSCLVIIVPGARDVQGVEGAWRVFSRFSCRGVGFMPYICREEFTRWVHYI